MTDPTPASLEAARRLVTYPPCGSAECADCIRVVALAMEAYARPLVEAEREACARTVPTSWLDPMLGGERGRPLTNNPPGRWGCPDIERLLRAGRG
jgi:hypothetical protein